MASAKAQPRMGEMDRHRFERSPLALAIQRGHVGFDVEDGRAIPGV